MAQAFLSSGFVGGRPARLGSETFTANGTYNANNFNNAKGKPLDGFSQITINTPYEAILDGSVQTIDTSVTTLRASAFANMTSLTKLVLRNASSLLSTIQNALPTDLSQGTELNVYVPSSSLEDYAALYGSVYTVNDISTYGRYWFTPVTSETTLTSSMYVDGITAYLTSDDPYDGLQIPSNITGLGTGSLTPITSTASTLRIYDLQFNGNISNFSSTQLATVDANFASASCPIKKFRYGGSANLINSGSSSGSFFYGCNSITEIYIDKNLSIAPFLDCANLTYFSLANQTSFSANYSCASAKKLVSFSVPKMTLIIYGCFFGDTALTKAPLPSATLISGSAFQNCTSLISVQAPLAATIGNDAFNGCSALPTISLPSAASIGARCFYNCSALAKLYILGSSVPTLGDTYQTFGKVYFLYSNLPTAWVATNWSSFTAKMVGVLTYASGSLDTTLAISGTTYNVTWYSDENLTTVFSGTPVVGTKYYAKLSA